MVQPGMAQSCVTRWTARHPSAVDLIVAALVAQGYLASVRLGDQFGPHPARPLTSWDFVAAAVAFALIAVRRRWPRTVLGLSVAGATVSMAAGEPWAAMIPAAAVAAYTVATLETRRTARQWGGTAALLLFVASAVWPAPQLACADWWQRGNVGVLTAVGMAVAIGDAVRSRRAYVAAVEERARRAEASREEEAQRRVIEERLRIARELHDVVAHRLALISVQSGVATHLMHSRPDQAVTALGHVREAANTAVDELGTVLSVLRQDSDPETATQPTPGLAQLPELLDAVATTGLRVRSRRSGPMRMLPAAADLAAYRIIQESLTNAHKHGAGATAGLRLDYDDAGVTIEVTNPVRTTDLPDGGAAATGTRHGLIGMRERATAIGGTLRAGPATANTFTVHAFVPAPESSGVAE
ncbi:sensor histidine kinase [Streptomyces sp. NPDC002680]|uniref:sensor histidine kinase n=1 Tax=Streptomyces sp. NPDC002680 TaxID=3364659 RepID=UPI00367DB763